MSHADPNCTHPDKGINEGRVKIIFISLLTSQYFVWNETVANSLIRMFLDNLQE